MSVTIEPFVFTFLPSGLTVRTWDEVKPYAENIVTRTVTTPEDFKKWLDDANELDVFLGEHHNRLYINSTLDVANSDWQRAYTDYLEYLQPDYRSYHNELKTKILGHPLASSHHQEGYPLWLRGIKTETALFRQENIPLMAKQEKLALDHGVICGGMTVTLDGEEITLPHATDRLFWPDRAKREEAWRVVAEKRLQARQEINDIFDQMVSIRSTIANNSGYDN
jgi:oligoendopeptidase F